MPEQNPQSEHLQPLTGLLAAVQRFADQHPGTTVLAGAVAAVALTATVVGGPSTVPVAGQNAWAEFVDLTTESPQEKKAAEAAELAEAQQMVAARPELADDIVQLHLGARQVLNLTAAMRKNDAMAAVSRNIPDALYISDLNVDRFRETPGFDEVPAGTTARPELEITATDLTNAEHGGKAGLLAAATLLEERLAELDELASSVSREIWLDVQTWGDMNEPLSDLHTDVAVFSMRYVGDPTKTPVDQGAMTWVSNMAFELEHGRPFDDFVNHFTEPSPPAPTALDSAKPARHGSDAAGPTAAKPTAPAAGNAAGR